MSEKCRKEPGGWAVTQRGPALGAALSPGTSYARLLLSRPRPARVPSEAILSLLAEAGVELSQRGAESVLPRLAAEIGVEPQLIEHWIQGTVAATFRDLCALALALDLHPEFARRGPVSGLPRVRTQLAAVPPAPAAGGKAPPPLDVGSGGVEVMIASGATEGYDPADYRRWLSAWLAERFDRPISVALGDRGLVQGLPPHTEREAFAEYKELTRKEVWDSGHALLNAIADWGNQPDERERHASLARVAALRILKLADTHCERLRLDLPEESALRSLAESSPDTRHRAIAEHSSKLFRCGRRIMDAWSRSGSGARSA